MKNMTSSKRHLNSNKNLLDKIVKNELKFNPKRTDKTQMRDELIALMEIKEKLEHI